MAWGVPPPGGGGKRGRDTKVSLPLLTPLPFLWTRRPSVARLKTRGPQGRLVLQGYTLDRSGAFRSGTPPPCTGWPRTVMRGAKEGLGESRGGKGTIWCPCPLLSPPPDGGILAGEHRHSRPPKAATPHALRGRKPRLHRLRRWIGGKVCLLLTIRFLRIYKAFYKGFS